MTKSTENVKQLYKYKIKHKLSPGNPPLTWASQDWGAKDLLFLNELGTRSWLT